MTEKELWSAYIRSHPEDRDQPYEAWRYGGDTPDHLAELTAAGMKTATSSAYPLYTYEQSPLPKAGELSVILDTTGSAVCITRTSRVTVVPYGQVSAEHAYREGEGDRSLSYWRAIHAQFFTYELAKINAAFTEDMPVVCEEFQVVFLPSQANKNSNNR